MTLVHRDLLRLAVAADCAPNTARRRLAGQPVRPAIAARLDAAARKLGIKLPRATKATAKRSGRSTA